jgi:membrane-bound lytic murein transglycosylase F
LPGKVVYAWAFRPEQDDQRAKADAFIEQYRQDGRMAKLEDRYFGHIKRINPIGASQFIEDMRTRLPRYRRLFQEAQATTGIDWRLLAALAYQESKWDPLATSYTGVRGMMMLTEETADRMGVGNRLSPAESIRAGALYLAELMERLPSEVHAPDRQWLALAAYNLGMGHLNGARQFAVGQKRDATSWYDMKKVLPLLSRPEYYNRLKSGRARGGEAVVMVENVRTYYDILVRFEPKRTSPLQTGLTMQ